MMGRMSTDYDETNDDDGPTELQKKARISINLNQNSKITYDCGARRLVGATLPLSPAKMRGITSDDSSCPFRYG